MNFRQATRAAALKADKAVKAAMKKYCDGYVTDEDDITGLLVGRLDAELEGDVGGLTWTSAVVRHRKGVAAEEKKIGADMVLHIVFDTPTVRFSKGVLVQAKRFEPGAWIGAKQHDELVGQCKKMTGITPSSFVFDYAHRGMRCGAATKIAGVSRGDLYENCDWTPYRFFLEFFRCPVGDSRLTSAYVRELPVPTLVEFAARGELSDERLYRL